MHFVPFRMKRAHYSSLKLMWPFAEKMGLTPARFDLLYAAHTLRKQRYQANIARVLGVSRTTIWRMVHALIDAGFVESVPDGTDWRRRRVMLTHWGRKRFNRLMKTALRQHEIERAFRTAIRSTLGRQRLSNIDEFFALEKIELEAWRITWGLRDGATIRYPSCIDNLDDP